MQPDVLRNLVEHGQRLRTRGRNVERVAHLEQRQHAEPASDVLAQQPHGGGIEHAGPQVDRRDAEMLAERLQQLLLGYPALRGDDLAEVLAAFLLKR